MFPHIAVSSRLRIGKSTAGSGVKNSYPAVLISGTLLPMPIPKTDKCWAKVDNSGRLVSIDWDMAEELAEQFRTGKSFGNISASIAALAVAVREHVLAIPTVPIPKKRKAPR
jgi:hypothetical protein